MALITTPTSCELKVKNAGEETYATLLPITTEEQVFGGSFGKLYGAYIINLPVSGWVSQGGKFINKVSLGGLIPTDTIEYQPHYEGTKEQMIAQKTNYNKIDFYGLGLNCGQPNVLSVVCKTKPTADFKIKVWWVR